MTTHHPDDRIAEEHGARLTAHALDQLEGRERDETTAAVAAPDAVEPRQVVAETRSIAEAARAARNAELEHADAPARSQDLRRMIVATLASSSLPAFPSAPPRRRGYRLALLAVAGSLAAALLVAVTGFFESTREVAKFDTVARKAAEGGGKEQGNRDRQAAGTAAPPPAARPVAADQSALRPALPAAPRKVAAAEKAGTQPQAPFKRLEEAQSGPRAGADASARSNSAANRALQAPAGTAFANGRLAMDRDASMPEPVDHERYARFDENRDRAVADEPLSTFSIDVDTASYANVRRFLAAGRLPPKDAVRVEELVNYFRYDDPIPTGDDPFSVSLEAAASPWHEGRLLVRIGIRGRDIERSRRPAGNLVFLIDVSGSMQQPDKLPLVKQALAMLVEELSENDRVSIVTYAGDAGLVLPPTTGDRKREILDAIERLTAGGSTHGSAGIALAYEQAAGHFIRGGANRVILATDGDLNVGVTSDAALVELIRQKAATGTFLTVLGFGQGNLQDEKMEKLADNGNGVYAYIDGVREARKVLVEQLTGSTITIAKDVKIQVEFNPARVASYRLLGYENRLLANSDFRDDRKDAGEIGAGHTVTALYEIVPVGAAAAGGPGAGSEPLKYQRRPEPKPEASTTLVPSDELLTVKLRFKQPDGDTSTLREYPLAEWGAAFDAASPDLRFAAAVASFGMILRESGQLGGVSLDDVARIAGRAIGRDEGGYRAEFLDLVRKAESLRGGSGVAPR